MIHITDKEQCCGCTACASVCAHGAIRMERDPYGFAYPQTDPSRCTDCGLCERVCPMQQPHASRGPAATLVALARDKEEQRSSASGGVASLMARHIIREQAGVVYGCTATDPHHVRHVRVDSEEGLRQLKGSKYVQSDMEGVLQQVKADVKAGRPTLFIGTPCQCEAVRQFMRKEPDNLLLIDFVCHGVPSQRMLSEAIRCQHAGTTHVTFRYRTPFGKLQYGLTLRDHNGHMRYRQPYGKDRYTTAFLKGLNYRPSCYACPFACLSRPGDLTVGDFWDRKKLYTRLPDHTQGLSQLHVNTPKGQQLLHQCRTNIITSPIPLAQLLEHSQQLSHPMPRHAQSEAFYEAFATMDFTRACNAVLGHFFRTYWLHEYFGWLRHLPGMAHMKQLLLAMMRMSE